MNYLKQRLNGHGGIIVLNTSGRFGIAHNTPRMAWALKTTDGERAGVEREALQFTTPSENILQYSVLRVTKSEQTH